jgi:hypothetical protein
MCFEVETRRALYGTAIVDREHAAGDELGPVRSKIKAGSGDVTRVEYVGFLRPVFVPIAEHRNRTEVGFNGERLECTVLRALM